jgi:nucleoside-diphosphate-sugar epimerase
MTVVVTGAAGLLGSHVVAALAAGGRDIRGVDSAPEPAADLPAGVEFVRADLRDPQAAIESLVGAETVVHAAAIPRPTGRTPSEVFSTNVLAAHNVVEAALLHRVPRLVSASSFSVLGWPFNPRPLRPDYLPIDEQHPLAPQEAYSLSKLVTEEILIAATRRQPGFSALSLRMPWIQTSQTFFRDVAPRRESPEIAIGNLWGYIDAADAAAAFAAGLDTSFDGHVAVYIAAADTFMEQDTMSLVRAAFPGMELRHPLAGHAGVLDCTAADRLLGFTARRSWRDYGTEIA